MLTSSIPNKSPYCVTNEQMTAKFGSPLQAEDSSLAMLGSYNDTELAASLHTKIFSNNKNLMNKVNLKFVYIQYFC